MHIQVFPFKLDSTKFQVPDGEKEHFEGNICPIDLDMEFKKQITNLPSAKEFDALENGKRRSSDFSTDLVNKRAKQEDRVIDIAPEAKISSVSIAAFVLDVNDKRPAATTEDYFQRTSIEHLEDVRSPLSERSHRRQIPIGSDHQADLPKWSPSNWKNSSHQSRLYDTDSTSSRATDTGVGRPVIDCYCGDEGSITCVRRHVKEAREKLRRDVGEEKFVELGFPDMGEDVARRWTKMEDNLFRIVVSSNSASFGRNFWTVLPRAFPSRSFRELVSYYFNVFILQKRANQNRFDPSNVDSDDDDWQEISHDEDEEDENEDDDDEQEEEEEEDSLIESPTDGNSFSLEEQDDEFCCDKPKQTTDRNSTDCSLDQDVQDDSCTSFGRLYNPEKRPENSHNEHIHSEYFDCDSKPWEINYVGGTRKDFEFFPTCNVLEEVFGKGSPWDEDGGDDLGFS